MDNQLSSLFLYLTFKCNLRCQHCWALCDSNVVDPQINNETIFKTIDEAHELGLKSVKITGGEPFCSPDKVRAIVRYLKKYSDVSLRMETNGTLITDDMVDLINDNKIALSISIHHWQSALHDEFVGREGAFIKVIKLLPKIQKKEVLVTVSKRNLHDVNKILHMLKDVGVKKVKFNVLLIVGRAKALESEELSVNEYLQLNQTIDGFMAENPDIQIDSSSPMCLGSLSFLRPKHELSVGCSFGNVCCMLPNGDISLCGWSINMENSKLCIGNIHNDSLSDIWARSKRIVEDSYPVTGVCSRCILGTVCKGGCRAISYFSYGELDSPYPICQTMYENNAFPKNRLIRQL